MYSGDSRWWINHKIHFSCIIVLLVLEYRFWPRSWWRHQMETFSALLAICAGNSPVSGEFPAQRPVTQSSDVFFDVRLIKRLSKHSRGWWFETLSHPLWRHRDDHSFSNMLLDWLAAAGIRKSCKKSVPGNMHSKISENPRLQSRFDKHIRSHEYHKSTTYL